MARQPIGQLELPTIQAVNDVRIARFKQQITDTLAEGGLTWNEENLRRYLTNP